MNVSALVGELSCSRSLFISHAWKYRSDYEGLVRLMNTDPTFRWTDLSVPFDDPLELSPAFPRSNGTIVDQLRERITQADCVLVIGSMCCAYRAWIQTEVEAAKQFGKPVIGVRPLGQERLPTVLTDADVRWVGWRADSVIAAIRKVTPSTRSLSQLVGLGTAPEITGGYGSKPPLKWMDIIRKNSGL